MSTQDDKVPDQAPERAVYTLRELRIDGLPRGLGRLRTHYATISIDQREVWRCGKLGDNEDALAWKQFTENEHFEALPSSTLELKLFQALVVVGKNGKEIACYSQSIQSVINSPNGQIWPFEGTSQGSALRVTLIMAQQPPVVQNDPTNANPELEKVPADAQDALSKIQESSGVPGLDKTMTALHSASKKFTDQSDAWQPLVDKLEGFMKVVDGIVEIHPYAKMAWSVVSAVYKIYKNQKDRDGKVDDLATKMKDAYDTIMVGTTLTELVKRTGGVWAGEVVQADVRHKEVLQRLAIQTVECGQFITTYTKDRNFFLRAGKQILLNPKAIIDRFGETFDKLQLEFFQQSVVSTEIIVVRVLQTLQKFEVTADMSGLRSVYVKGAGCNSQKQCLPGTREAALDEICDWVNSADDNAPQIRLLLGQAGTGKSTIAHTVACRFDKMRRLGAAFCFGSSAAEQSRHAFATLAIDLADFDSAFKASLWNGVGKHFADQTTHDLVRQFENFILKPSEQVAVIGSVLILLEGLDEIGDVRARASFLRILSQNLCRLPQGFRILLTSRPEPDILSFFKTSHSGVTVQYVESSQYDPTLRGDMYLFISTELKRPDLGIHDLDESDYLELTERSEGLFQWASLACAYIIGEGKRGRRPRERYEDIMKPQVDGGHTGGHANILDDLYQRLLPRLIDLDDSQARNRFKRVMGIILNSVKPLTIADVQDLIRHLYLDGSGDDISECDVSDILSSLGSLLSGVSEMDTPVRPLHSSFRDFLTTASRSKKLEHSKAIADCYIGNAGIHHVDLATSCLRILTAELHFNMCELDTSYWLNEQVPDLKARVDHFISSPLSYASRFWAHHIRNVPECIANFTDDIKELLETKFLYWIEVLSLLQAVNLGDSALSNVIIAIGTSNLPLAALAIDGRDFVRNQAAIISTSAPQIYISALASTPDTSLIQKQYGAQYPRTVQICQGRRKAWQGRRDATNKQIVPGDDDMVHASRSSGKPSLGAVEGHSSWVSCVAFSPDGSRIVSGSDDNTVRLWNAETGTLVGPPLRGHTDWVKAVAFSPDGKRVVSGSDDNTIRIWDAKDGTLIGDSLEGHRDCVRSIAFSPDGNQIISGSGDCTIRIWDAETGTPIGAPLEGHSGCIWSVAFSPDGKLIASGSDDKAIRIWNAATGRSVGSPLKGHSSWVKSVVFSPTSNRIVSGSADGTIRIWDAENGTPLSVAMHSMFVQCVAFSSDGKLIASGSGDKTIQIWDAVSGKAVGSRLVGHSSWVTSVAFSPDSKRLVSCSADSTIRIWDTESGIPFGSPLEGHTDVVRSATFSPDGKRMAFTDKDETRRVLEAGTAASQDVVLEVEGNKSLILASCSDGKPVVCGVAEGSLQTSWQDSMLSAISFCPDIQHRPVQPYPSLDVVPPQVSIDPLTGWVMCNKSDYLFWLPPEQLKYLCTPRCRLVIPTSRMVTLNMSRFVHGERWTECYQPN